MGAYYDDKVVAYGGGVKMPVNSGGTGAGTPEEARENLGATAKTDIRKKATGSMTFYIRTTGSNSNDGTTEVKAMQTFNALMLRLYREWDFQGYDLVILVGEGTWAGEEWRIVKKLLVGANLILIKGAGMGKTLVTNPSGIGLLVASGSFDYMWLRLQFITLVNNLTHINLLGSTVLFRGIEFGALSNPLGNILQINTGFLQSEDNFETDPSKFSKITAPQVGSIVYATSKSLVILPAELTIAGSLAISSSAFILSGGSELSMHSSNITGTVTGRKFYLTAGSVIINSSRAPGSIAGTADISSFAL
jgi:hypothetical protein